MLKKRIIGSLLIKNRWVVQSVGFHRYLPIGKPAVSVEFLNHWGIDEILLLDLDATSRGQGPDLELLKQVAGRNYVPLTFGGGIRNLEDIRLLVHGGADKVCLNNITHVAPFLVREAADVFGTQCIVACMDVRRKNSNSYEVYRDGGNRPTGKNPVEWARELEDRGAGEIIVQSVDGDGKKSGYEIKLIRKISSAVTVPVIALGGAGHPQHFLDAFQQAEASSAAAGNFFHFTEHSPILVKSFLRRNGVPVRIDTQANYHHMKLDEDGRLCRQNDKVLKELRFIPQHEEVI